MSNETQLVKRRRTEDSHTFERGQPLPFDTIGLFTYLRTYARRHNEDDPNSTIESWAECIERVVTACNSQLKCGFTDVEQKEIYNLLYNLKCSVAGRFLWQLGTRTVERLGLPSLQNCFRRNTEFWTSEGIKSFADFQDGDKVIVRGKTKWFPATVKNFGEQKLFKLTVKYVTARRVIYTTSSHRWLVKTKVGDGKFSWKIRTTTELEKNQRMCSFSKKTNFHLLQMCPVGIQHGIVYGDGNMRGNVDNCAVTLCGEKKELSRFFFTPRKENREITGLPNTWKTLPPISMNKEYLLGFLAGWFACDGSVSKCQLVLSNKDPEVLHWARGAFSKLDISCGPVSVSREVSPFDGSDKPCYRIAIYSYNIPKSFFLRPSHLEKFVPPKQKMEWRVESVEETDIVEDVWCVVEPKEENFTLADGLLTKNCAYTTVDEPIKPFVWTMNFLMLGSGVGYRLLPEDVDKLPLVKYALISRKDTKDADYIVPDSREGWVKLLGKVLKAHFYSGQSFTYSCTLLRSKGAPIKSFGGVASGPEVLCDGMEKISSVLNKRAGQKLRPVDALDIMNIIGMIVVSGNVRRSAQLAIGDCRDREFLNAKNWASGTVPNWRAFSNNSVVCNDINDIIDNEDFWKGYDGSGEPYGLINLKLSRACGRLGETQYPDSGVEGYNPCLTGDTMILTSEGLRPITDLVGKKFTAIIDGTPFESTDAGFWKTGVRTVYKITLENGAEIKATGNHKFYQSITPRISQWTEVRNLKVGIKLVVSEGVEPIRSIEILGDEEVYDCTIPVAHCFFANGFLSHNCAEQSLNAFESCVTGDTLIQTDTGCFPIVETVGKEIKIFNGEEWSTVVPFKVKDEDEFYEITFSDGSVLKATPGHEFSVSRQTNKKTFVKLRTDELEVGMYLPKFEIKPCVGIETDMAYTIGAFTGDGYMDKNIPMICCVEDKQEQFFEHCKVRSPNRMWKNEERPKYMYRARVEQGEFTDVNFWRDLRDYYAGLPREIMSFGRESILQFFAGWIDTDGSTRNKGCSGEGYIICGCCEPKMRDAQILLRRAGINFASLRKINCEGEETNYGVRNHDMWALQIPTFEAIHFPTILKKTEKYGERYKKNPAHPEGKEIDTAPRQRIISIEKLPGKAPSYCFTEMKKHMGVFGNVLTYQCCLSEIFLPNIKSKEELFTCARYLYRICKHSLTLPCDSKDTEQIVHQNMRMGIGVTGYLQATDEQRGWLSDCYKFLREHDKSYSIQNGFPTSIKLTTCKPSGSLSLLGGCTSGVHPGFSQYYKRRIRISSDSPLIGVAKKHGYPVEYSKNFDGTLDHRTQIITFPHRLPEGTVLAENCTAIDQLEWVKKLQTDWSDNSVSVTVYYRKHELPAIKDWLRKNYNSSVKTVSFLLHSDHGFVQAPMEAISKHEYEELAAQCRPITELEGICYHEEKMENLEGCGNGLACPLR